MTTSKPTTASSRSCEQCGAAVPPFRLEFIKFEFTPRYCIDCGDRLCAEREAAELRREAELALDRAGRTKRLDKFTWEGASMPNVGRRWLADYAAGGRNNLILCGNVGAGKTGLAWLTVRAIVEQKRHALFLNFRDLLWEVRQSFDGDNNGASLVLARAQTIPVLALDDLGAERPTAWARSELATIIDRRYEKRLPTIVTSNYSPSELANRLGHDDPVVGKRIVSRLTERADIVQFTNSDRRLAA